MITSIADALRSGGVAVVEEPGWATRGQPDGPFTPRGIVYHHDASAAGPSPSIPGYLADLSHPGAQLWVDTTGTWHVIAAGRMWHAGAGPGWGVIPRDAGNTYAWGVETDHTTGEAWPAGMLEAIARGMAAMCLTYGWDPAVAVCGHKEYAPGRKVDPDTDMGAARAAIRRWMDTLRGGSAAPAADAPPGLPPWSLPAGHFYGDLHGPARSHGGFYPAERSTIRIIQQRLIWRGYVRGVARTAWRSGWADGLFEQATVDAVTRFQRVEMPATRFYGQVWSDDYACLARS